MEQHSLVLCGKKHLEWKKEEIGRLQEDELLIRTIAGAISIGAELPQFNENDNSEIRPIYPKETGYESYYDYGMECSATNSAFACLQKGIKENGEICILSDGNKEEFFFNTKVL